MIDIVVLNVNNLSTNTCPLTKAIILIKLPPISKVLLPKCIKHLIS